MPEGQSDSEPATANPGPPPSRPEPPPYKPRRDLIGYIERGQKTPEEQRDRSGS
jgi:hypothetical protein